MAERGSLDALAVVKRIRDAVDQAQEGHDPAAHRAIIRAALDELDAALAG